MFCCRALSYVIVRTKTPLFSDGNVIFFQERRFACLLTSVIRSHWGVTIKVLLITLLTTQFTSWAPSQGQAEEKVGGEDLCNGTVGFKSIPT